MVPAVRVFTDGGGTIAILSVTDICFKLEFDEDRLLQRHKSEHAHTDTR